MIDILAAVREAASEWRRRYRLDRPLIVVPPRTPRTRVRELQELGFDVMRARTGVPWSQLPDRGGDDVEPRRV